MEDYIYLIIAILLSIFGALRQNKQKRAEETLSQAEKPRNHYQDVFQEIDFFDEPEEKPVPPPVKTREIPVRKIAESSSETSKGMKSQQTRFRTTLPDRPKHAMAAPMVRSRVEEAPRVEAEEGISYLEDFSLRKAVIYSMILERKY